MKIFLKIEMNESKLTVGFAVIYYITCIHYRRKEFIHVTLPFLSPKVVLNRSKPLSNVLKRYLDLCLKTG